MKSLVATPFITISREMHSHRSAQGVIYADMLEESGKDVRVNMTLSRYVESFNDYDELYVYHGNDWSGSLNLFGGLKEFPYIDNFVNFSQFKGKVYSLIIDFPDYHDQLQEKIKAVTEKGKEINPLWNQVDWDNLKRMESESITVKCGDIIRHDNVITGDSHAICMYRRGWEVNSVPFKTLHGALEIGLDKFLLENHADLSQLNDVEFYFGNIDVRHHLCRFEETSEEEARKLARRYHDAALDVSKKVKGTTSIYELLPIEDEKRSIPKTGWYKGTPFFGSWHERNRIRLIFKDEMRKLCSNSPINYIEWVDYMINDRGELDFKYMERPKSVHISREYYPYWQGKKFNGIDVPDKNYIENKSSTLELFL